VPKAKKPGYTKRDLRAVSDNPELTKADFAKARPFSEVFPDLKKLVSLRLSPEVVEHFKSTGKGWQSRIDETLRKVVKRKAS
jgi:uncharacterized protein (DUF4415 family)